MNRFAEISRRGLVATSAASLVSAAVGPARAATPFFKLYIMIPNNQPARMIWGTLAAQQMARIGIDVISSFVPFTVIAPRRSRGDGKTHPEGGWDCYLERYYYNSIKPIPEHAVRQQVDPAKRPEFLLRRGQADRPRAGDDQQYHRRQGAYGRLPCVREALVRHAADDDPVLSGGRHRG